MMMRPERRVGSERVAAIFVVAITACLGGRSSAADCNGNRIDDAIDLETGTSADCNGNGIPDECDLARGGRSFARSEQVLPFQGAGAALGDLDGDGDLDWVSTPEFRVVVAVNDGSGRFHDVLPVSYADEALSPILAPLRGGPVALEREPPELFLVEVDGPLIMLRNEGGFRFAPPVTIVATDVEGPPVVVDLDGDTLNDALVPTADQDGFTGPVVAWNEGDGEFSPPAPVEPLEDIRGCRVLDADADGRADIVAFSRRGPLVFFRQSGFRAFAFALEFTIEHPVWDVEVRDLVALDVDGDGVDDLAVLYNVRTVDYVTLLRNVGGLEFSREDLEGDLDRSWRILAFDQDLDGVTDLFVSGENGEFYRGEPGGRFWFPRRIASGNFSGVFGDVGGDHYPELVVGRESQGGVIVENVAVSGFAEDCNGNGVPDYCEFGLGDRDDSWLLDACEPDCDGDGQSDGNEIENHDEDLDGDGVPDSCAIVDCDGSGVLDFAEIGAGIHDDCNANRVPDVCELNSATDCDGDGVLDECTVTPRVEFRAAITIPSSDSYRVETVDLDDDGRLDLVRENFVQFGRGDLRFTAPVEAFYSMGLEFVRAGDVNGDGISELIDFESRQLTVWHREAELDYSPRVLQELDATALVLEATDADGDGDEDILVGWVEAPHWSVFLNHGDGSFDLPIVLTGGVAAASDALVTDLTGDGLPDLVALVGAGETFFLSVFVAHVSEDGALTYDEPEATPCEGPSRYLAAGDFDGDGVIDLAVASSAADRAVRLYRQIGRGFTASGPMVLPAEIEGIAVAELAGERRALLAVVTDDAGIVLSDLTRFRTSARKVRGGRLQRLLDPRDLDGDGRRDLIASTGSTLIAFPVRDDEVIGTPQLDVRGELADMEVADLNGDGRDDLAVVDARFAEGWVAMSEAGEPLAPNRQFTTIGPASRLAAGDLDGNGTIDLVLSSERPEAISSFVTDGTGGLLAGPQATELGFNPIDLVLTDFDGDLRTDVVVVREELPDLATFTSDGSQTLVAGPDIVVGSRFERIWSRDLDGDGDEELVLRPEDLSGIAIFRNEGGGHFAPAGLYPSDSGPVFADLDGDSSLELVTFDRYPLSEPGRLLVFPGLGSARFGLPESHWVPGEDFQPCTAADLDGDGDDDLVGYRHGVTVLFSDGERRLRASHAYSTGTGTTIMVTGDWNGDGLLDLATTSEGSTTVALLEAVHVPARELECDDTRPRFLRGDANDDGVANLSDAIFVFGFLFLGTGTPSCHAAADIDGNRTLDISDGIALLSHLFLGFAAPPPPWPACGEDPGATAEGLGCESFASCVDS